jgi:hypothetical protein
MRPSSEGIAQDLITTPAMSIAVALCIRRRPRSSLDNFERGCWSGVHAQDLFQCAA